MATKTVPTINPFTFKRALTTNSTAASYQTLVPKLAEPIESAANGIYKVYGSDKIEVIPFGTDGENDTFNMRVVIWNEHRGSVGESLWIPRVRANVAVVLGTVTGVAASEVVATEFFADSISLVTNGGSATFPDQVQGNTVASFEVPIQGAQYIQFDFDLAGAQEGVAMNALFTQY